ncbi:CopG family transcriptional regulator [Blastochloris tepida]|uniref:CopG family transcriptional regulator n=2 Tax=Blastochloris tepida TaxID=2233851 RepID=A0A348FY93_9HYPH|nr:CopG family transcriptional regulator [Blastochloris tepida]
MIAYQDRDGFMMRTMTISLSHQQAERVQQAVESGAYASNSEVVREALRLWAQREEIRALELAKLKQAYDQGMASGPPRPIEPEALLAEFKARTPKRG